MTNSKYITASTLGILLYHAPRNPRTHKPTSSGEVPRHFLLINPPPDLHPPGPLQPDDTIKRIRVGYLYLSCLLDVLCFVRATWHTSTH